MAQPEIPPSREVRLEDGITHDFSEHVALSIYSGGSSELLEGISAIELTIEAERAGAARRLARLLKDRLLFDGYIVVSSIDDTLESFLESEVVD